MSVDARLYQQLITADPELLALLRARDAEAIAAVRKLLRMTRLARLAPHARSVSEVLGALGELPVGLRSCWEAQDRPATTQILGWMVHSLNRRLAAA